MNTDSAFITGNSHRKCEDYARSGNNYVLVSDGCSSSTDSDFGARILVKISENLIVNNKWNPRDAIVMTNNSCKNLGLKNESSDATLITAIVDGNNVNISAFGDGFIFIEYKDGKRKIIDISYPSGYPYYLNYIHDPSRIKIIQKEYEEKKSFKTIEITDENGETIKNTECFNPNLINEFSISEKIENINFIAIMTDGISSFVEKKTKNNVSKIDIIKDLCCFKNTVGEAAQRRMNAFVKNIKLKDIINEDDLSLGVIFFLKR